MRKRNSIFILIIFFILFAIYSDQNYEPKNIEELRENARARAENLPMKDFTTDGCSLWLNGILGKDFTDACIEHDISYWKGCSLEERTKADIELKNRVNEKIPLLGDIMYLGVRVFGHPSLNFPWSWGYGLDSSYGY